MAIRYVQTIDMGQNQILNLQLQNLASDPGSPVKGQIWINTTTNILKYYDGTTTQTLGQLSNNITQFAVPTSSPSMNGQTIQNLGTPVNSTDAATKGYVDSAAIGLDVHASVVAATTVAGTLATSFANGSIIDGVTLATGNRILIKNQSSGSENGIYTVNVSGAPTRATDCNTSTNYITGSFTFVEEGTINQGASFVVTTQGSITVGSTSVSWVQFAGIASTATSLSGGSLGSVPYQSAASTTVMLSGPIVNGTYALVEVVTSGAAVAPTFSNAPALSAANMSSFPTLNQSTTGTAAGLTGSPSITINALSATTINGAAFSGTFTGAPTFSGNISFTGTPTFSNTLALNTSGTSGGLTGSPSITVSGITDSGISTAGLVTSSSGGVFSGTGKALTGSGASVPTGPTTSISGDIVTFTGTAGQITDSGRLLSSVPAKYAANFGDGASTIFVITHNLGTTDVVVGVSFVAFPYQVAICEVQLTSTNTITLLFATIVATNTMRVVVIG